MRLGIGSYAFAWSIGVPGFAPARPMTAGALLEAAAALGVDLVQIYDNVPLTDFDDRQLDALAEQAARQRISVEVGARGIGPAYLRRYLQLAVKLGSPLVRVVIDTADDRPTPVEAVERLRPLVGEYRAAGVQLALENHDRFTAEQFARIVQQLDSPAVGICLDTVNSFGAREGPAAVVSALAPRTISLHVKDFAVRRADHQMGFTIEGRPAGEGQLDVPWLLAEIRRAGRDPNAILEQWPPPERDVDSTIAKEQRWARQSIDYLRTLIPDTEEPR